MPIVVIARESSCKRVLIAPKLAPTTAVTSPEAGSASQNGTPALTDRRAEVYAPIPKKEPECFFGSVRKGCGA
jgi:hypothetical protein